MDPLLYVNNLRVDFFSGKSQLTAVRDISFNIQKGETLAIVGESGSGKSVTALSIMRLISTQGKISSGEIIYSGENTSTNLLKVPEKSMTHFRGKEIAMIFQEPMTSLNPVYTCGYQVVEAIQLHFKKHYSEAKQQTLALFEQVKLPDPLRIFKAYPHQLSGGQKQRVMIAMAMSCKPQLLIADEPTTALDVTVQARILQLLKELIAGQKLSMLFITHDLELVAGIADRVAVMFKGQIVEQGNVYEIFNAPKHPYTKALIACKPSLDKRFRRLPVVNDFMSISQTGEVITKDVDVSDVLNKYEMKTEVFREHEAFIRQQPVLLSVQSVSVHFPAKKNLFGKTLQWIEAVKNVSLDVKKGETLGLAGESGCGKTTLGRTILKLISPTSGKIIYKENDLTNLSEHEMRPLRKHFQMIFQDPYASLNPRLTIGYALTEPMRVHKIGHSETERKKKVFDLLDKVQMTKDSYERYPHEFSGGQRQRICIARALAVEPEFLICDECVSALDVSVQAQVLNLLKDLQDEFSLTYIFISHDLSVVKFMSDRIMIMNKGSVEEIGDAEQVYHHPASSYTKELIGAIPSWMNSANELNRKSALTS